MNSPNVIDNEKSFDLFQNVKSSYILQKIFYNLSKKKSLNIIKYNKKLQQRENIDINDYKEYVEIYSDIEIEIIPDNDKYGKFINIKNEEEIYYHIYFDNNEEIKRNCLNENEQINSIKIIIDYQVLSFGDLFSECKCIKSLNFKKFNRKNINNMSYMFYGCTSLKELNLSNFNTNNVTNMHSMFYGCSSLKKLNLSKFNTNNVTDMGFLFFECSLLNELDVSHFNTSNVTNMSRMFDGCILIKKLNLSNFITNNVDDMSFMFSRCTSLKELDLSNFNTNKVTNMREMFKDCSLLKELNLSNFNVSKVSNMSNIFFGCSTTLIKRIKAKYKNISKKAKLN